MMLCNQLLQESFLHDMLQHVGNLLRQKVGVDMQAPEDEGEVALGVGG